MRDDRELAPGPVLALRQQALTSPGLEAEGRALGTGRFGAGEGLLPCSQTLPSYWVLTREGPRADGATWGLPYKVTNPEGSAYGKLYIFVVILGDTSATFCFIQHYFNLPMLHICSVLYYEYFIKHLAVLRFVNVQTCSP